MSDLAHFWTRESFEHPEHINYTNYIFAARHYIAARPSRSHGCFWKKGVHALNLVDPKRFQNHHSARPMAKLCHRNIFPSLYVLLVL